VKYDNAVFSNKAKEGGHPSESKILVLHSKLVGDLPLDFWYSVFENI
jgi:hypothetical protein